MVVIGWEEKQKRKTNNFVNRKKLSHKSENSKLRFENILKQ